MRTVEVIVYSTISIDGGLDYVNKKIILSSERDLQRLHYIRSIVDAIVVGANTVIKDNPLLTVRLPGYTGRQPYRVVIDGRLRLTPNYRVFDTSIAPSLLITSVRNCRNNKLDLFRKNSVEVVCVSEINSGELDLLSAFKNLHEYFNIRRALVEGGGILIGSLLKQKLIDKLIVSISPTVLGSSRVSFINTILEKPVKLKIINIEYDHISDEIIVTYKPIYE